MATIRRTTYTIILLLISVLSYADNNKINYKTTEDGLGLEVIAAPEDSPYKGEIIIPEEDKNDGGELLPVVAISASAFKDSKELTSISIPKTVTCIGTDAFKGCSNLKKAIFSSVSDLCNITFGNNEANPIYLSGHLWVDNQEQLSVTIPDGKEEINSSTFAGAKEIIKIFISKDVNTIGNDAFAGCTGLLYVYYANQDQITSMTYKNSNSNPMVYAKQVYVDNETEPITEIAFNNNVNAYACKGAKWLKKVTFGNSVKSIGKEAFSDCLNLSSLTLPVHLESIESSAFTNCKTIKKIKIPSEVSDIGQYAFNGCSELEEVDIEAQLSKLPNYMFYNCKKLRKVSLATNIKIIGQGTFARCESLIDLDNFQGIEYFLENAFENCTSFKSITIPKTVELIDKNAFINCNNLTELTIPEDASVKLSIMSNAFSSTSNSLKTIYSYSQIAPKIEEDSFGDNNNIQAFFPENGEGYDKGAWLKFSTKKFTYHTIQFIIDNSPYGEPRSVLVGKPITDIPTPTREGWDKFNWKEDLPTQMPDEDLVIHGYYTTTQSLINGSGCTLNYHLTSWPKEAIIVADTDKEAYLNLTKVTVGPTIEYNNEEFNIITIDDHAFKDAIKIETVDLSQAANITRIGNAAFDGCTELSSISLPNSITGIADSLFINCKKLTNISISGNITSIGNYTFSKSAIESIKIPKSITSMGTNLFLYCTQLKSVEFEKDCKITTLPACTFKGCTRLINIISLPASIITIEEKAFEGCNRLESFIIEDVEKAELQDIGSNAFSGCGELKAITLPISIKDLGSYAFDGCKKIEIITIYSEDAPIAQETTFSKEIYGNAILYVPQKSQYSGMDVWLNFSDKIFSIDNQDYKLTYKVNDQQFGESQTLKVGTQIIPKEISEHPLYEEKRAFSGWKGIPSPAVMPNTDITVTGEFEYQLTYKSDSNEQQETLFTESLFYGSDISYPKELTKDKYKYEISDCDGNEPEKKMPAKDYTLIVKYIPTETDYIDIDKGYKYHIFTEGDNPHAELMPGDENAPYTNIEEIDIPNTVNYLDKDYDVTVIQADAFRNCSNVKSIKSFGKINTIGSRAFAGCSAIETITIPESIKTIGDMAFQNCVNLKGVYFNGDQSNEGVVSISPLTFNGCTKLYKIDLPSSLESIGSESFCSCKSLEEIRIPKNVNSIDKWAFFGCDMLKAIYLESETKLPEAHEYSFQDNIYNNATLYILNSINNIQFPWNSFNDIQKQNESAEKKCQTPQISYNKGELTFTCADPTDAIIRSEISVSDATKIDNANNYKLTKTYTITAYAIKDNYKRSDTKTATFKWQDGKLDDFTGFDSIEIDTEQPSDSNDHNGDGVISAEDAAKILKKLVGKEDKDN